MPLPPGRDLPPGNRRLQRPRRKGMGGMMTRLAGKIAWVTGAGTGIGEAAARALAEEGAPVILTGRRRDPLETVAARINQTGSAHVQPADLTDKAQVQTVADYIRATFN